MTLPGTSYLAALDATAKQDLSGAETVLTVLGINVIMLMVLELALIGCTVSPDKATGAIERGSAWLSRDGAKVGLVVAAIVGLALVGRGIGRLLS